MDRMIVTRAEAGEETGTDLTFEEFFRAVYPRLAQAGFLLTGDPEEGEELAQDAMVRVYERWDQVRAMDSPEGYVYRTAMNLHRKKLRRAATFARLRLWEHPPETDPAHEVGPRLEMLRVLRSLTREQRQAVVLTDWLGLSAEEAGPILGISAASVRARVHRARLAARERHGGDHE